MPGHFVACRSVDTIIISALQGIAVRHKECQQGIFSLIERIIDLAAKGLFYLCSLIFVISFVCFLAAPFSEALRGLLAKYLQHIVNTLIGALCGLSEIYALYGRNGSLCDVLFKIHQLSPSDFQVFNTFTRI